MLIKNLLFILRQKWAEARFALGILLENILGNLGKEQLFTRFFGFLHTNWQNVAKCSLIITASPSF